MLWEREKKKNGGGVRLGAEREEEGADRIYSENCARGAGAVGQGLMDIFSFRKTWDRIHSLTVIQTSLMDTSYFLLEKLWRGNIHIHSTCLLNKNKFADNICSSIFSFGGR